MPTVKTKKEMDLGELIEWGIKNGITSKEYSCDNKDGYKSVIFDIGGKVCLNRFQTYLADDKYEVEVEEEVTEDTKIPEMLILDTDGYTRVRKNHCTSYYNSIDTKALYMINGDMTMTLIWKNGKMVE